MAERLAAAHRQPLRRLRHRVVPRPGVVPPLHGTDVGERLLAREGTLWTWTVQGFRPKSPPYEGPVEFEPYPVGYVELPGEVKVETRAGGCPTGGVGDRHADGAGDRPVHPGDRRCRSSRSPSALAGPPAQPPQRSRPMSDVAIVGIGMHPFGRHPISGREQGAIAARRRARRRRDRLVRRRVRLRRLVGRRRRRHAGVATSASPGCRSSTSPTAAPPAAARSISAYNAFRAGAAEVVMAIGFDKHPRGRVRPDAGRLRHRRTGTARRA